MTLDRDPSVALARRAAQTADDKKGTATVILDVGDVLSICGYFVVTSAPNTRLVRTIAEEIWRVLKLDFDAAPVRVEGLRDLQWVLLDYGDVVVHVFHDEARAFYDIERLYRDVARIGWESVPSADGAA